LGSERQELHLSYQEQWLLLWDCPYACYNRHWHLDPACYANSEAPASVIAESGDYAHVYVWHSVSIIPYYSPTVVLF
jgi:hypothetical protein